MGHVQAIGLFITSSPPSSRVFTAASCAILKKQLEGTSQLDNVVDSLGLSSWQLIMDGTKAALLRMGISSSKLQPDVL